MGGRRSMCGTCGTSRPASATVHSPAAPKLGLAPSLPLARALSFSRCRPRSLPFFSLELTLCCSLLGFLMTFPNLVFPPASSLALSRSAFSAAAVP
eukprot:370931-Rhodomonas_salina.8